MHTPRVLSGRYRLIETVGEGGPSPIWRAYDEVLRRRVAVKVLAGGLRDEARLRAGVQAAAFLNHPSISAVYDYGVADGEPFIVTELLDGVSLAERLVRGPLPWRKAAEVCGHVAAALSAAHERRLAHRGIGPRTVMLTGTGVKVVDFGIAALTAPRETGGPAADVYDLGVLLFTTLTGGPPARGKAGLFRDDPEPAALPVIPGMPLEIAALYQDCVAAEPAMRPSAAAVARRLAAFAGAGAGAVDLRDAAGGTAPWPGTESRTVRATDELQVAPRARRRTGWRVIAVSVAATVAAVAAVGMAAAVIGTALSRDPVAARWSVPAAPSGGSGAAPGAASSAPASAAAGTQAPPSLSCSVAYRVKDTWDNGANVSLSIVNTGKTDVRHWVLSFDLGAGSQTRDGWNGTWQQQGERVTVAGLPGHADLPAGSSINDVGAGIDGQRAADIPTSFTLNGTPCTLAPQP
ncbi:serine/threonine-protein kinase [Dactylosporangium sp. AC04546]|uniref:protein kinase domain-containing protein n=1 Tax=Dactylosporangium sp. AC04546 TaxID=2862460 RepID=UPI001EDEF3DC|nr:serine/threonine-protein kinase [Dactylosporangium sp. AC04546]WVK79502.1 serine/threonine-protein kinase [Dactylosporangium sp. AC04546]